MNRQCQFAGFEKSTKIRDLWLHKDLGKLGEIRKLEIPKHGIIVFKTVGK